MDNLSGKTIKGYQLHERIGTGGFGVVYRAQQTTVGREVAVKIILPGFANKPDFIRRFETEAQLVARLEHMHITPLYDYWRDPSGAYLVMRYLRGGSLREALHESPYDLRSASRLLDQVTSGLALAHRTGVIHRDLKPGNILLDEDGNAYLADFGIAKVLGDLDNDLTKSGVIGSLDYISPEQARGESVTPRTDIYSLGVVFYETLTGEHPFPGSSPVERLYKHLNDPIPVITSLGENGVQVEINAVLQKATAKNPAVRFEDVLAFAAAFQEAIGFTRIPKGENVVETLTLREQEVLGCIIDGMSNREIAQHLFITLGTVKWYVNQIYRKLGVRGRVQAIVRARELKLVVPASISDEYPSATSDTSISVLLLEPENPYKGLQAFQPADHRFFFGRNKLIKKLLSNLMEPSDGRTNRFLAVVGPSGSGKSSLVKAGLIPALWRGDLPGSERWFVVEMLPGAHPLEELEIALLKVAADQSGNLREQLGRDARGLLRVAKLILPEDSSELVVVIDQFEEIFTLVGDEAARVHFLDLLTTAVGDPRSRVRVVITLRADFYDRPLHYPEFGRLVRNQMETVLPLSADEVQQAIVRPAEMVGVKFEGGLVPTIIDSVHYQPGALPLLQFALTDLFDRREGRHLTREAYEAMGGAVGALGTRAEAIYNDLTKEGQETVRQMFLRLVTLGEGVEDTRRRVARSELIALAGATADSSSVPGPTAAEDLIEEILDTYTAYRLLTVDHDPGTREPTVEVAHEAILREWSRLRDWLDESRLDIHNQRALSRAAADWLGASRDPSFLLRGSRLDQFEVWAVETDLALTADERAYLNASLSARGERQAEEAERLAHEASLEQRSRRFLWLLVGVFAIATVVAVVLSLVAFNQSGISQNNAATAMVAQGEALILADARATQQAVAEAEAEARTLAEAQALADRDRAIEAEGNALRQASIGLASQAVLQMNGPNPERAVLLGLEALENYPYTWQAEHALGQAILNHKLILDLHHGGDVNLATLSPDGTQYLTSGENGWVKFWDADTGEELFSFMAYGGTDAFFCMASWSPSGDRILTQAVGGPRVWDAKSGAQLLDLSEYGHFLGDWSADGTRIITWYSPEEATAVVWDAATGEVLFTLSSAEIVKGAHWSPDGKQVGVGFVDYTVRVWDVATGEEKLTLFHEPEAEEVFVPGVTSVAWSPSGKQILSTGNDGSTRVWDAVSGDEQLVLLPVHEDGLWEAKWSPDETRILTFGRDGLTKVWDTATGEGLLTFSEHSPFSGSWSPDGSRIATTDNTSVIGSAMVWDAVTGEVVLDLFADDFAFGVSGAAWSPNGHRICTFSEDKFGRIWDASSGEELLIFNGVSGADSLRWSPSGDRIQVAGFGGAVVVYDANTGDELIKYDVGIPAAAQWSPDGTLIAIYDFDGNLWIYPSWQSTQELIDYAYECCLWRELTPEEREQFGLE